MKQLKVLLLSDAVPGHVNQAKGLLECLSKEYSLDIMEANVQLKAKGLSRSLARYVLNNTVLSKPVYSLYQQKIDLKKKPDLILSAGGNTSFLNAALARYWKIPNIFIGSLRRLNPSLFSVILTLEPVLNGIGHPNNIVMDFAPTLLNPGKANIASKAYLQEFPALNNRKLWLLVIGGNGAGFNYEADDWKILADHINRLSRAHDVQWLITSSRRTGEAAESVLRNAIKTENIAEAVWWNTEPKKVMLPYLGLAEKVFVTADSMSMITECFSSGKPTVAMFKESQKVDVRYMAAITRLSEKYIQLQNWSEQWVFDEENTNIDVVKVQSKLIQAIVQKIEKRLHTERP